MTTVPFPFHLTPGPGLVAAAALLAGYLTPAVLAEARRVPDADRIARLTVLFGWTGVGWAIALKRALAGRARSGSM